MSVGCTVIFDLCDEQSFHNVISGVKNFTNDDSFVRNVAPKHYFVIGDLKNIDDKRQREVSYEQASESFNEYNLTYIEVNTRTGLNFP